MASFLGFGHPQLPKAGVVMATSRDALSAASWQVFHETGADWPECLRRGEQLSNGIILNTKAAVTAEKVKHIQVFSLGMAAIAAADKANARHVENANRAQHGRNLTMYLNRSRPELLAHTLGSDTAKTTAKALIDAVDPTAMPKAPSQAQEQAAPLTGKTSSAIRRDAVMERVKKLQAESAAQQTAVGSGAAIPDSEMRGRRALIRWTHGILLQSLWHSLRRY